MEELLTYAVGGAGAVLLLTLLFLLSVPAVRKRWNAGVFGTAAQIASAIVGFVGFALVVLQLHENRAKASGEAYRAELADARRLYVTYSASAIQHPELAEPDYNSLLRDHWEYVRYKTFVSHMLWAYDDMLNVIEYGGDSEGLREWVASFDADVQNHLRYICHEINDDYLHQYRPSLKRYLVQAEGNNCKDQQPLK